MKKADELVLLYQFTDEKRKQAIVEVLEKMRIPAKTVTPEQIGQKVGYLAGLKNFQWTDEKIPEDHYKGEVLVFQGINPGRIQEVLGNFTKADIEKISIKATVTPKNIFWPFYRLCERIQKEHGAMQP